MADSEGREAVLVHGAGGGGWEWAIWSRIFAARGSGVRALDLVPCSAGLAATTLDDYVAQVCAWSTGIAQPLLVGASLGGLLALLAAPRMRPAALVLVNPLPPAGIEPRTTTREYADVVPWGSERSLAGTRRALFDADDAACLFAFRRWRDESGRVLRAAAAGVAASPPGCPALVIASECDDTVPVAASRALAAQLGADLRVLPGASHVGPLLGRGAASLAEQAWRSSQQRGRA